MSYNPYNRIQLDVFVLKKYEKTNNGFEYIMCMIDIFNRKMCCYPLKSKLLSDTTPVIQKILSSSGIHEFNKGSEHHHDSDAAFRGNNRGIDQNFQKVLIDNNAVLEPVKLNDHHGLGVIDVFTKNLKRVYVKGIFRKQKH